jgi:hypothetical protein
VLEHRLDARVRLPGAGRVEPGVQALEVAQGGRVVRARGELLAGLVVAREQGARLAEPGGHHVEHGAGHVARDVLLQPRHRHAGLPHHLAAVGRLRAVEHLEERALAAAVAAEQADALAALHGEARPVEHGRAAEGEGRVAEAEQGHRGGAGRGGDAGGPREAPPAPRTH